MPLAEYSYYYLKFFIQSKINNNYEKFNLLISIFLNVSLVLKLIKSPGLLNNSNHVELLINSLISTSLTKNFYSLQQSIAVFKASPILEKKLFSFSLLLRSGVF